MQVFPAVAVVHSAASYATGEAEEWCSSCHLSLTAGFCPLAEAGWLPKENCGNVYNEEQGQEVNPPAHDPNCLLMVKLPFTSAGISHGMCPVLPALHWSRQLTSTVCAQEQREMIAFKRWDTE